MNSRPVRAAGPLGILALVVAAGCARRPAAEFPTAPVPRLPLTIDVVYPVEVQWVAARDSTFLFGSVTDPKARLFVGGTPVPVYPNGAFLAWTPIPREPGDTSALFEVVAVTDEDTTSALRWVRVPKRPEPLSEHILAVDTSSPSPRGALWALPNEPLRFSVRATTGARAWVEWPGGERFPLVERNMIEAELRAGRPNEGPGPRPRIASNGASLYVGILVARSPLGLGTTEPARLPDPAATLTGDTVTASGPANPNVPPSARPDTLPRAILLLARGADTLRQPVPLDLWILDPARPPVVGLLDPPSPQGTDGIVFGRPTANGTYVWFLHDGLRLPVSGRAGDRVRLRLAPELDVWIDVTEQRPLPEGTPPPRARVRTIRMSSAEDRVQVQIALTERVPYLVTEDERRLELALYHSSAETDWVYYGEARSIVRQARWRQEPGGIFILALDLEEAPWGYRVAYEGESFILTVRRAPSIDPRHPLRGRRIAIDPGHPPAGSTGPTRLYEGDVNLAIARILRALLEDEGAEVILTRAAETDSVPLYTRPLLAESADAEILVSIHNNAFPDGVRPFESHGTSVFYYHPHSLALARALQESLLRGLGLRDLGIGRANLALARSTWMPAALTEGAFIMIPEQEALLRTPEFQERYARGVFEGIEEFLRGRARGR